mgnify:CR=1 FL=1
MHDHLLIGVDGGGTGCRVRIADKSLTSLAESKGGPANVTSDRRAALANITTTIAAAADLAGISPDRLLDATVHLGLAGVMSETIAEQVAQALPYAYLTVTDDRPTTLAGALAGQDGFLIAAGTGSFIAALQDGTTSCVGGWGYQLSDQASAAWLGRRLLEHVLLCHDGLIPHSDLTRSAFIRFNSNPNDIILFGTNATPGDFGLLAPLVVEAQRAGDAVGGSIMKEGLAYLTSALGTLGFHPGARLCLTGGVGQHYATQFPKEVQDGIITASGNALDGAIRLAAAQSQSKADRL